jgi:hypothetical protein
VFSFTLGHDLIISAIFFSGTPVVRPEIPNETFLYGEMLLGIAPSKTMAFFYKKKSIS